MVKQIPAAVAHPTLANPVLPWTSETGPLWLDAKALHCVDDFLIESRVAITQVKVIFACQPPPAFLAALGHFTIWPRISPPG
jgi:hypothetical protein